MKLSNRAFGSLILVLEAQTLYQLSDTVIIWEAQSPLRFQEPGGAGLSQMFQHLLSSTLEEVLLLDGLSFSLIHRIHISPQTPLSYCYWGYLY